MPRRSRYLGRGQIAVCMRSGIKCKASELVRDGRIPSLLVLPEWADPPQPQERPYVPNDLEGAPRFDVSPDNPQPNTAPILSGAFASGMLDIVLTWTAADFIAGPRIERYRVLKEIDGEFELIDTIEVEYSFIGEIEGPALTVTDTEVVEGETYRYKVQAVSDLGSLNSNILTMVAVRASAPALSGERDGLNGIDLTWTPSTPVEGVILHYVLYRAADGGDFELLATLGDVLSYTDTAVAYPTDYEYFVVAIPSVGADSNDSNVLSIPGETSFTVEYDTPGSFVFTPPDLAVSYDVAVIGGGGGGWGAGSVSSGVGGSGGGLSVDSFAAAEVGTSPVTVTVGAGGIGGVGQLGDNVPLPNQLGGLGGTSSFGVLLSATGGVGGTDGNLPGLGGVGTTENGGLGGSAVSSASSGSPGAATTQAPAGGGGGSGNGTNAAGGVVVDPQYDAGDGGIGGASGGGDGTAGTHGSGGGGGGRSGGGNVGNGGAGGDGFVRITVNF